MPLSSPQNSVWAAQGLTLTATTTLVGDRMSTIGTTVEEMVATQSRVVRMAGTDVGQFVRAVHPCVAQLCESDGTVFALLGSHEEAQNALVRCRHISSVGVALQADFPQAMSAEYTLSTNPPNPKSNFRLGDWICPSPKCAAHNFGRNLSCIGCGSSRPTSTLSQNSTTSSANTRPTLSSPRFTQNNPTTFYSSGPTPPHSHLTSYHNPIGYPSQSPTSASASPPSHVLSLPNKSAHPLLTPSGRVFAVGGKVQNISSDPLNPCIMYWPDNEPFPEQGQIRPSGLAGIPQPPILNTGNRGPISHQPGDWICQKCNYLNWRRRKVCQTCLPYAEGNGDSISAAVQAERIALLTNVLAQTTTNGSTAPSSQVQGQAPTSLSSLQQISSSQQQTPRSHSLTPPQLSERRSFLDVPSAHFGPTRALNNSNNGNRSVHRSQSHFALGQQYATSATTHVPASPNMASLSLHAQQARHIASSPIYQTPLPQTSSGGMFGQMQQHQPLQSLPLLVQNEQVSMPLHTQRHPSPLLYATGPVNEFGSGRARVVSSPGPGYSSMRVASRAFGLSGRVGVSASQCSSESTSSIGSIGSEFEFGFGSAGRNDKDEAARRNDSTPSDGGMESEGENESTPAIAGPLLPAFLQDFVRSPVSTETAIVGMEECESAVKEESPRESKMTSGDLGVLNLGAESPSSSSRSATLPNATYAHHPRFAEFPPLPRTRNDSGSSSTSSSGGSVSGCGSILSTPSLSGLGGLTLGRDGGIWRMDGEESKSLSLKGVAAGSVGSGGGGGGGGGGSYGLKGDVKLPLPLPIGAEKRV